MILCSSWWSSLGLSFVSLKLVKYFHSWLVLSGSAGQRARPITIALLSPGPATVWRGWMELRFGVGLSLGYVGPDGGTAGGGPAQC